jgi:hypothetical protein
MLSGQCKVQVVSKISGLCKVQKVSKISGLCKVQEVSRISGLYSGIGISSGSQLLQSGIVV